MRDSASAEPPRKRLLPYLSVLGAGILWGTSGPFSVALFGMGLPPESVAILRTVFGGAFLAVFLLWANPTGFRPPPRALLTMLVPGGIIVGTFQLSFQMSTNAIGVPSTVALLYLAPAFVMGVSPFVLGERLTVARALLALLSVAGVWMTVAGSRGAEIELSPEGIAWGVMCGVTYGSYAIFGRILSPRLGSLAPLFFSTLGGALLLAAALHLMGIPVIFPTGAVAWTTLSVFALTTIALAALLLFHAVKTIDAGRAAIGTTVEPLVAAILAMALLGQGLSPLGWLGMVTLVGGVIGAYLVGSPPPPSGGGTAPSEES